MIKLCSVLIIMISCTLSSAILVVERTTGRMFCKGRYGNIKFLKNKIPINTLTSLNSLVIEDLEYIMTGSRIKLSSDGIDHFSRCSSACGVRFTDCYERIKLRMTLGQGQRHRASFQLWFWESQSIFCECSETNPTLVFSGNLLSGSCFGDSCTYTTFSTVVQNQPYYYSCSRFFDDNAFFVRSNKTGQFLSFAVGQLFDYYIVNGEETRLYRGSLNLESGKNVSNTCSKIQDYYQPFQCSGSIMPELPNFPVKLCNAFVFVSTGMFNTSFLLNLTYDFNHTDFKKPLVTQSPTLSPTLSPTSSSDVVNTTNLGGRQNHCVTRHPRFILIVLMILLVMK